jgi:peptide/nickel transport system permease protein
VSAATATRGKRALVRLPRSIRTPGAIAAIVVLLVVLVCALFGDAIAPYPPTTSLFSPNVAPNAANLLGTDGLGRDLLSRIIAGTSYTMGLAVGATALALIVGVLLGALAGFFGGWVDAIVSRIVEMFLTIPSLFFAILLVAFLGSQWWVVTIVLGATMWPITARLTRSEVLALRGRSFVEAAQTAGVPGGLVVWRHVLPNGIAPVVANASLQMAEAVLLSAGLSFIGLGDPSAISWGKMIQEGQSTFQTAWWQVIFPGLALSIVLLALHVLADSIGEHLRGGDDELITGH